MLKKSFLFVIICLLFGALSSQLSAQDNGSFQRWFGPGHINMQVFCDGVIADVIHCTFDFHVVYHMKDGVMEWRIWHGKGHGINSATSEEFVFNMKQMKEEYPFNEGIREWHYHLIGNMGTVYIGFVTFDWETGITSPGHTVCK
jgi:hypothetical protein